MPQYMEFYEVGSHVRNFEEHHIENILPCTNNESTETNRSSSKSRCL